VHVLRPVPTGAFAGRISGRKHSQRGWPCIEAFAGWLELGNDRQAKGTEFTRPRKMKRWGACGQGRAGRPREGGRERVYRTQSTGSLGGAVTMGVHTIAPSPASVPVPLVRLETHLNSFYWLAGAVGQSD
jgi:hypothetical protein